MEQNNQITPKKDSSTRIAWIFMIIGYLVLFGLLFSALISVCGNPYDFSCLEFMQYLTTSAYVVGYACVLISFILFIYSLNKNKQKLGIIGLVLTLVLFIIFKGTAFIFYAISRL